MTLTIPIRPKATTPSTPTSRVCLERRYSLPSIGNASLGTERTRESSPFDLTASRQSVIHGADVQPASWQLAVTTSLRWRRLQQRLHVRLVRLDARLAVGIDT